MRKVRAKDGAPGTRPAEKMGNPVRARFIVPLQMLPASGQSWLVVGTDGGGAKAAA
ncbi:MAG TPA: hypothetical protein VMJ35_00440 [Dongiaceae bacterium]|nr:hypothetical protein [Dongiaceae bacterium]